MGRQDTQRNPDLSAKDNPSPSVWDFEGQKSGSDTRVDLEINQETKTAYTELQNKHRADSNGNDRQR